MSGERSWALEVEDLSHAYGTRRALDGISLKVREGEIFGLLGPNGGGKTTLFKILSTLIPISRGRVWVMQHDLVDDVHEVRRSIGVVFQAPSLDKKLRVEENLIHQGHLYGLGGQDLKNRIHSGLRQLGVLDRAGELVEKLSGGLQRRVEIAKALLHRPGLLLLDEPSTGLDPGARKDMWDALTTLRRDSGTTVVLTTHLMEEAERCDRLAILDHGRVVALDAPEALRRSLGGEWIMVQAREALALSTEIRVQFGVQTKVVDDVIRFENTKGHDWIPRLMAAFPGRLDSVTVGRPTLEDVFIEKTGHRFASPEEAIP